MARQEHADTLTIGLLDSPSDLDPHSLNDFLSGVVARGVYEPLIMLKEGKTDEYEGRIAETWEANVDKSVWTFHLREGVTFQDGSPCDAEAVRASCERLLTLGMGLSYVLARFVSDPRRITAPDDRTVIFDLGQPQPLFEAAITASAHVVNVKAALAHEEGGDWGNAWLRLHAEGTGTGPYRVVEFEPGNRTVLERYEGYWGGWDGPHFDRVIVRTVGDPATLRQLIERGEVDIIDHFAVTPEALPELERRSDLRIHQSTTAEVRYFALTAAGPLATPEARRAMCFAFPYDEVIEGVSGGLAKQARGPIAEKVRGFAPETFQYTTDLAKARDLFAQAGIAEGTALSLILPAGGEQSTAQLFQANLAEIGILLSIEGLDLAAYTAILFGDTPVEERPNVMEWSWWPEYNDAWIQLYATVSCEAWGARGGNAGFYCNERVDDLLDQARDAADLTTYEAALAEVRQILSRDDPPAIYIDQPVWTTVLRHDVAGFVLNPVYLGSYDLYALYRTG